MALEDIRFIMQLLSLVSNPQVAMVAVMAIIIYLVLTLRSFQKHVEERFMKIEERLNIMEMSLNNNNHESVQPLLSKLDELNMRLSMLEKMLDGKAVVERLTKIESQLESISKTELEMKEDIKLVNQMIVDVKKTQAGLEERIRQLEESYKDLRSEIRELANRRSRER